jgi:formate-dependent nitrite reductase membrane component NrfD
MDLQDWEERTMLEYDIVRHLTFDWAIVTYFFLGGLSAGAFFFSVAAKYWKKEFEPMAKTAALVAPVAVAAGMILLLVHLGRPLRAWRLALNFRPTSALSWGFWFLGIYLVLSIIHALFLYRDEIQTAKGVGYAGLPFAFLVSVYSAVLLHQAPGKVLWHHTAVLPWLFLTGGVISGISFVMLLSDGKLPEPQIRTLGKFLAWLVVLELAMITGEIIVFINGGSEEVTAAMFLLAKGKVYTLLFWLVEVLLGAAIPLVILFIGKFPKITRYAASILLLVGIYMMRYIVVIGGQIIS